MLVLSFAVAGTRNSVRVGGVPYVYARTVLGSFVSPALCTHRGGPLHLATVDVGRSRLVCPWHGGSTSATRLRRRGIPAVRRGDTVTAVFPVPAEATAAVTHLPLSADLCRARAAG